MLLFTVIGPVKGQSHFTFALQPGRKYTVGSSPQCDIVIDHTNIEAREGEVIVGDWDMDKTPYDQPTVRWNKAKMNNGAYKKVIPLVLEDEDRVGSIDFDDYLQERETSGANESSPMGIALTDATAGIAFADQMDVWFTCRWEDVHVHYDKMKSMEEDPRPTLEQYGILFTESFQWDFIPTHTISEIYKVNPATSIAVSMNRPIVKPEWLSALVGRLRACWKPADNSQDSFALPDVSDEVYLPTEIAGSVGAIRQSIHAWRQDTGRTTLFRGWSVVCLKSNKTAFEGRYLRAMGAEYEDLDISASPIQSQEALDEALKGWLAKIDAKKGVGRSRALVMFSNQARHLVDKDMLEDWGYLMGVGVVTANLIWLAVSLGDTSAAVEEVRQVYLKNKDQAGASPPTAHPTPAPLAQVPAQTAHPPTPTASQPTQDHHADAVPSTFPEESAGTTDSLPTVRPPRRHAEEAQQETVPETHVPPAREKLVRRKGRPRADPFAMFKSVEPSSGDSTPELAGSQSQSQALSRTQAQASFVPESVSPTQRESLQYTQAEGTIPSTQPSVPTTARARRAARPPRPFFSAFDTVDSSAYMREAQAEQDAIKARELYEETAPGGEGASLGGIVGGRGVKRVRGQGEEVGETQVSVAGRVGTGEGSRSATASLVGMDVDGEDEEDDLYSLTLKRQKRRVVSGGASTAGKRSTPAGESSLAPPPGACSPCSRSTSHLRSPSRSPSPEVIPIEVPALSKAKALAQSRARTAAAAAEAQSKVCKPKAVDEAFLSAIEERKKKRAEAEKLEKGFGQLAIHNPKDQGGGRGAGEREWVDYGVLDDFQEEMRGNFIEVVKMPLFRKDLGKKKEERVVDEGKPNFKKFKKKNVVKRQPLQMVLSVPAVQDVDMAEPYWPTQAAHPNSKSQSTQTNTRSLDPDDDALPLMPAPRARKRRLADNPASDDDDDDASYGGQTGQTATQRGGRGGARGCSRVPDTQEMDSQQEMQPPSTAGTVGRERRTRGDSVVSEVSVSGMGTAGSMSASTWGARVNGGPVAVRELAAGARGKGRGREVAKEPVAVEDSEEDEADGVDWGMGAGESSAVTATAKGRGTRRTRGESGTATRYDDEPSGTATARGRGTGAAGTQSATAKAAAKRKKLLPADDDDGMGFGNFGKRRRVR